MIVIERIALETLLKALKPYVRLHPWHGVPLKKGEGNCYNAYIEMVPTDEVKYEVDKDSGILTLDRPQKFASHVPALYGFLPRTYCGNKVAEYCMTQTGLSDISGDNDPLDICVLSEKPVACGDILVEAVVIGGLRMIDDNEADDKIIAVLKNDALMGQYQDLNDCPKQLIERIRHYFLTYKNAPGDTDIKCRIAGSYGKAEALWVISLAGEDYNEKYPDIF